MQQFSTFINSVLIQVDILPEDRFEKITVVPEHNTDKHLVYISDKTRDIKTNSYKALYLIENTTCNRTNL